MDTEQISQDAAELYSAHRIASAKLIARRSMAATAESAGPEDLMLATVAKAEYDSVLRAATEQNITHGPQYIEIAYKDMEISETVPAGSVK